MYYFLNYSVVDSKKDMWFSGTIYNKNKDIVEATFGEGTVLKESELPTPLTIILNEKESSIKRKIQNDKISTSVIESGFLLLISPTAQGLFKKLNLDNLQYFDVSIKSKTLEINDYKIVNITDKIDCADISASDIELYDNGKIRRIRKLVIDESKIPRGKQIFLLGRRTTGITIVHEGLKKSIEEAKLTGFQFVTLDKAGQLF